MKEHRITVIRFDGKLQEREIPSFRGAILNLAGNDPMYHNHKEDVGFHFRYPMIQYKVLDGFPAIVGLDAGAESLESLFRMGEKYELQIGRDRRMFTVLRKSPGYFLADESFIGSFCYTIHNWLPFNVENYRSWQQKRSLAERVSLLDSILRGNILMLYKAFDVFFTREIHACIMELSPRNATYKGVSMVSFDIMIETDVALPEHCGIGKGVSHGFGVVEGINL